MTRSAKSSAPDLATRLDGLTSAISEGDGRLSPSALHDARDVVQRAGERLRISGRHTVVALAGATGSGKSSLFNALTGRDLSPIGVTRPTTAVPHAAVWGPDIGADLLSRLGIAGGNTTPLPLHEPTLDGLILVDLPDFDSTEVGNRLQVDRILELVDLFVWVVDPQKYADAVLHDEYLRPLAMHAEVMLVAFNQVDRVTAEQAESLRADLARLLRADGLADVPIVRTSTRTGEGLPALGAALTGAVRRHEAHVLRIAADIARVAKPLAEEVAGTAAPTVGRTQRNRLVDALEAATGAPAIAAAAGASYRREAGLRTGWPVTRWMGRLRRDPLRRIGNRPAPVAVVHDENRAGAGVTTVGQSQLSNAVRAVVDDVAADLPGAFQTSVRRAVPADDRKLAIAVDEAIRSASLPPVRPRLWWRALGFLQILLAVALVAGLVWLAVLAAFDYFRLPEPPTYKWGEFPLPTLLVIGGVVAGLFVAFIGRLVARVGARRRARQIRALLRARLTEVARVTVIEPLQQEVARLDRLRAALATARGD